MYIEDFIKILTNEKAIDELKIEMLGLISYMRLGEVWADYLNEELIQFIMENLDTTSKEEDIVLETLGLVSNLCASESSCKIIASSDVLQVLP